MGADAVSNRRPLGRIHGRWTPSPGPSREPERAASRCPGASTRRGAIAWAVPFILVLYLALSNGGYDVIERSEVGIALWWLLLVGVAFGTFTIARGSALAPVAIGLVLAYAAWTAHLPRLERQRRAHDDRAEPGRDLRRRPPRRDDRPGRRPLAGGPRRPDLRGRAGARARRPLADAPRDLPRADRGRGVPRRRARGPARLPAQLLERARRAGGDGHPAPVASRRRGALDPAPGAGRRDAPDRGLRALADRLEPDHPAPRRRRPHLPAARPGPPAEAPHAPLRRRRGRGPGRLAASGAPPSTPASSTPPRSPRARTCW